MKTVMAAIALVFLGVGCGTVPHTPIQTWNMGGDHLIYFEQADRVPKDVMIEAIRSQAITTGTVASANALAGLTPEQIAEIIKEIMAALPELAKTYSNERMNEALVGRRILIRGYNGTNELVEINQIIQSLDGCIEKWTQPNKK